ncbi:uncharacterized protein LOC117112068 [Anneissia japonica]|uniref:uncharacterized protein LOC117112068 n=1 Tax=Anneissia japonica TaxID=1529436 RepID=UPI001425A5AB|nr:uncharacterized protein LOC117112068 [Anneissia japonica]
MTFLHFEKKNTMNKEKDTADSKCTTICGSSTRCNDNSMIVPVWMTSSSDPNTEMLVYCILDPQSNTSFISDDAAANLNLKGQATKMKLSTMHGATEIDCKRFVDLRIASFDRKTEIKIPVLSSRKCRTARRSQIPTPMTALQGPHLTKISSQIPALQKGAPVAILVGNDVPRAVQPRDVIAGGEDEPYAQQTSLGWGIIGTVCKNKDVENSTSFYTASSAKETIGTIQSMFHLDFAEYNSDAQGTSVEDQQFIKIFSDCNQQRTL